MSLSDDNKLAYLILAIAVFLYEVYGVAHLLVASKIEFYWAYVVTGVACLAVGRVLLQKYGNGVMFIISSLFVMVNTYILSNAHLYTDHDLIFSMVLMFGILEFGWLMTPVLVTVLYSCCTVFTIFSVKSATATSHFTIYALVPLVILIVWKGVNTHFQHRAYKDQLQLARFRAFQATVVRLNHEFNNIGAIILGFLDVLKNEHASEKEIDRLSFSLNRFLKIIKQIKRTNHYQEEHYGLSAKMVSLNPEVREDEPKSISENSNIS